MATARSTPAAGDAGAFTGLKKTWPLRTGPAPWRAVPGPCSVHPSALCFIPLSPFAVQKSGIRASSCKGRKLYGCTRSLRVAALPFPPAFSLMPARLFKPYGEEPIETSLKPHGRHNMSQQNINTTASEFKESSFSRAEPAENVSYDAIRRAFRRNLFTSTIRSST